MTIHPNSYQQHIKWDIDLKQTENPRFIIGYSNQHAKSDVGITCTSGIEKCQNIIANEMYFKVLATNTESKSHVLQGTIHDEEVGTRLRISGSKVEEQEPISCPAGSNFIIKNLFFNIPARRKFLKGTPVELKHVISEFERVALVYPQVDFSLFHNETQLFSLSSGNLRQRISGLFGKQLNTHIIDIKTETSIIKISGFIGKPEYAKKTSGDQYFFVNGRYFRSPYLHKAVMNAYNQLLTPDAVPSYFIYFETDPASIDVNIHPTKTEIKFEDERAIWQILHGWRLQRPTHIL